MTHYNCCAALAKHIAKHTDGQVDLYDRFRRLDKHLVDEVHPSVGQGAAITGIWLTDHGPRHIQTVFRRIESLTFQKEECIVKPYHAYLLAVAAHFHDIGNVFGRKKHESNARDLLFSLDPSLIGSDIVEKRKIYDIARAHGGRVGDSKDTIGSLLDDKDLRKLAAILRFADELADDHTRTLDIDKSVLEKNEEARKKSEIYHLYSELLSEVRVDHNARRVCLSFNVLPRHLSERYYKDSEQCYLLDEIFERTLKLHREQIYCSRFMMPDIVSERTDVEINVCSEMYAQVLGKFQYTLEQNGYPDHIGRFGDLVADYGLDTLTGATVATRIHDIVTNASDDSEPLDLNDALWTDQKSLPTE